MRRSCVCVCVCVCGGRLVRRLRKGRCSEVLQLLEVKARPVEEFYTELAALLGDDLHVARVCELQGGEEQATDLEWFCRVRQV